ncbi:choice-of-anchor K domain-containing protein [Streptomyces tricolor]|uniref:choice-of-anchor K domain-containing protein n=1 Tax=Streptomyces tricolor TaxID=68277 RepID=UPI0036F01B86
MIPEPGIITAGNSFGEAQGKGNPAMGLIETSGKFTGTSANLPGLTGVNTGRIRWGQPASGGNVSGYDFEGHPMEAILNGREFPIGKFTHYNYPILLSGQSQFWVYLTVTVHFENGNFDRDINVRFRHDETPNQGPHPNDVVLLQEFHVPEKVYVDNVEYDVEITGFRRMGETQTATAFNVPEGQTDSAWVYARFQRAASVES